MKQTAPTHIVCEQNEQVDQKLKKFVENIEALEEEKKEISQQISDTYKEAKAVGFDAKTMRKVIALRKKTLDERTEEQQLVETYKEALNMA